MERRGIPRIRRLGVPLVALLLLVLALWGWRLVTLISQVKRLETRSSDLQAQIEAPLRERTRLSAEEEALKKQISQLRTESSDYDLRVKEARQLLSHLGIKDSDRQRINELLDRNGRRTSEDDGILPRSILSKIEEMIHQRRLKAVDLELLRKLYPLDTELAILHLDALIQQAADARQTQKRRQYLLEAISIGEGDLKKIREGNAALEGGLRGRIGSAYSALADQERGKEREGAMGHALDQFEFAMEHAGAARRNDWYVLAIKERKKLAGGSVSKDVVDYACDDRRIASSQVRMNNCAAFLNDYAELSRKTNLREAADAACKAATIFRPINDAPIENQRKWLDRMKEKCAFFGRAADAEGK